MILVGAGEDFLKEEIYLSIHECKGLQMEYLLRNYSQEDRLSVLKCFRGTVLFLKIIRYTKQPCILNIFDLPELSIVLFSK